MVGIAEEPPRQLAPSVGIATLDFVIRARSIYITIKLIVNLLVCTHVFSFVATRSAATGLRLAHFGKA
jgi:hypothetical protein